MSAEDAKMEFFHAQLRAAHPEWSFDRIFQTALEQFGQSGSFARTEVVTGTRSVAAKDAAARRTSLAVTVRASACAADDEALVQAAHPEWTAAQVEKHCWKTLWS